MKTVTECPTIEHGSLSPREFQERFVDPCQPVIIRGGMTDWPALPSWSEGRMAELMGDKIIPVRHRKGTDASVQNLTMAEFERRAAEAAGTGELYYLAGTPILVSAPWIRRYLLGDIHELAPDIRVVDYFDPARHWLTVIHAGNDTRSSCHYHPFQEAMLCQLVGRKTVKLFPPFGGNFQRLQPFPWYHMNYALSRITFPRDLTDPDPGRYPSTAAAECLEVTLDPGEMLYIPIYWWHVAYGLGVSHSVGTFWMASFGKRWLTARGLKGVVNRWMCRPVREALGGGRIYRTEATT